ncbi:ubiquitin carboxyl-terminal hydrolase 8-like isoform X1 [Chenopodium quinoa]|uniref:ubiquitin carboxyl-terminal hydrolase 8-like isoform X1 n=3 Tax=Chenopodium quinoa TaxID=63459 RepID=UPI000B791EF9|nr:ubiquitin carboxyl-terminal hydrolase 8-like isoform X1 [Chenopodium quinoa]
MDDVFDPDEFLAVDDTAANTNAADDDADIDGGDDGDFLHSHARRRRRIHSSPPSSSASLLSFALRHDRLFLVSYKWWKDASEECLGSESVIKGVRYAAAAATDGDENDRESDADDEIVLNLHKEVNDIGNGDDKGEGFSGREYALITESMWFKALKWHSDYCTRIKDMGCSLAAEDDEEQDVFSIQIRLCVMQQNDSLVVKISLMDNPVQLYRQAYEIFDVQSYMVCIWDFSGQMTKFFERDSKVFPYGGPGQASEEALLELQVYGLPSFAKDAEVKITEFSMQERSNSEGSCSSWPSKMNGTVVNQSSSSSLLSLQSCTQGYGKTGVLGLTGLVNLGNTCFMNSAIQCLAHTPKLVDYFLGDFKKDINYENPLGMNGELALSFGALLRKLWAPGGMPVAPRLFKSTLENFAPQFCGYNQHDSQELLAFLLDGLHEDLNRVKHKPYIQHGDTEDRPVEKVADEHWQIHLARNDSIIVDLFHGQFRSKLVCPICKRVSVTFDPFMYLSLPLPSTTMRTMTVTLLSTDGSVLPSSLTVTVPKYGTCKDLIQALSTAVSLRDGETLFVAEVYYHCIIRSLENPSDSLALIRDEDCLVAYRLPKESESGLLVVFMHQRCERQFGFRIGIPRWSLFGTPLVARISSVSDGTQIHDAYIKLLQPLLNMVEDDYDDIEKSDNEFTKMGSGSLSNSDNSCSSDDEMGADFYVPSDFQFHISDERGLSGGQRIKLGKPLDVPVKTTIVNVLVSWSKRMLRRYDTCHLSSLPEVFKPIFPDVIPQESVSLYKCMEGFLKEEPLGPEDMWYCPSCKQHRQASKKLDLWRLPEILVVHLKRFSYSRFLKNKLETYVDFPLDNLDLTGFLAHDSGPSLNCYRLYAISNHYGCMGGGHYTALVYHGNRWYEFNDGSVKPGREDDIKTSAAYVLFYRRIAD